MRATCRDVTGSRARSSPGTSRSALLSPGAAEHTLRRPFAESVPSVLFSGLRASGPALPSRLPSAKPAPAASVCLSVCPHACSVCPEFAERSSCLSPACFQSLVFRTSVSLACPCLPGHEPGFVVAEAALRVRPAPCTELVWGPCLGHGFLPKGTSCWQRAACAPVGRTCLLCSEHLCLDNARLCGLSLLQGLVLSPEPEPFWSRLWRLPRPLPASPWVETAWACRTYFR